MKNVLFGLFLISGLSLSLVSCDDDDKKDGGPSGSKADITGEWLLTKEVYKNCDDPDENESYTTDCLDGGYCWYITFDGDGNFVETDGTDEGFGTYKQSGNKLTLCYDGESCDETVKVSKNGNKLVVTYNDGDCDVEYTFTGV